MHLILFETKEIFTIQSVSFNILRLFHSNVKCCVFAFLFLQGEQFVFHEDWGEALVSKSSPVLCVLDIEGDNVSVLEGVPENISPGQVGTVVCAVMHGSGFVHFEYAHTTVTAAPS